VNSLFLFTKLQQKNKVIVFLLNHKNNNLLNELSTIEKEETLSYNHTIGEIA